MSWNHAVADVAAALRRATTVSEACQAALDAFAPYTDAMTAVVLPVRDHLRCVAATGSWQVFSMVPPRAGVVGRVYASGQTSVVTSPTTDQDYIPLGPPVRVDIAAPILGPDGKPIGAINFEYPTVVDTESWVPVVERIAAAIGSRIIDLGGPPAESRSEKLVRHGLALTSAATEVELLAYSLVAAVDVTGLDTAVLLLTQPDHVEINIDLVNPTPLARRIAEIPWKHLEIFITRAQDFGATYTIGDPADYNAAGFEVLTSVGVKTLIAVPVGANSPNQGVLLVADERAMRQDGETVNLLGLLAAQAWGTRERLRTLAHLARVASSDPLTGLRHQGAFGERMVRSTPGQTAVFAIDVDSFKAINDTYGHQAGDQALVDLAQALSAALRTGDELYRVGGDEFAAIAELSRPGEAASVADRLVVAARTVSQTISVGVAVRQATETFQETLGRADAALYLAKRGGKDRAHLAD